ncbi:hypothetical protein VC83_05101 [Pseudogymnoascus destructans]|uniref:RING-type E3 ubiquitin transferase n=2 Tax=Pseudogymnoascus destructans TaxID=655981 RepID=L8FZ64_PSED2|nr:uncharacterized protein VC83_05101 [Pseudogymnoascus destructans]ELR05011.1 hypothetical protein GMDG_01582 [Pseudogymnoascus destructans 20631-21]OAF58747.2 hypothetical protein VC83_05101 [Pseudogymnoascus destructans]
MTSEAELRARFQTSRFREIGLQVSATQADEGSADPPQAPIIDTAEPNILGEEEPRGLMANEEDPVAANTDIEPIRRDEEDPAIASADTEPIRADIEPANISDIQSDDGPALQRLSLADESLGIQADPTPPASQPSTSNVPSLTPSLSNQEAVQGQTVTDDDAGNGVPSSHATPVEPGILSLPLDQGGDIPAQPPTSAEAETLETEDIGGSVTAENIDNGQSDGTTCSTRNLRDVQRSESDSEQGRPLTSQRDEHDVVASTPEHDIVTSTADTDGDEATANTVGPPRWQPDAEVTYCPICRTQFSFFIRKHHCRKCGRVVCANCSPHRITIPYQFIVQPPVSGPATTLPIAPLAGRDIDHLPQFGGTKVRLCNPCVPDPNTLPPQPQRTAADERWRDAPPTYYLSSNSRPYSFGEQDMENLERQASAASVRSRAVSSTGATHRHQRQLSQSLYPPRSSSQTSYLGGSSYTGPHHLNQGPSSYQRRYPNRNLPPGPRHQSHQSLSMSSTGSPSNAQPHYRSLLDPFFPQQPQPSSSGVDTSRPLPPIPRIREEDECPVCHCELPSRTLLDFESLRSNHVTECIEDQIAIHSGRPRQQSPASVPARHERPSNTTMVSSISSPPEVRSNSPNSAISSASSQGDLNLAQAINLQPPALDISSFPNTPEGRTAFREAQHAAVVLGHTRSSSHSPFAHPSSSFSPEPRRTGMFPYKATEKDCVDDAECTICLDEFEVGVQMARLECLCRFHEKCIRSWWEGKPGRCPVHGHCAWGL